MIEIRSNGAESPVADDRQTVLSGIPGRTEAALNRATRDAVDPDHAAREAHPQQAGRKMMRGLLQDGLDLNALREVRATDVTSRGRRRHGTIDAGRTRTLTTVFGQVMTERPAYRNSKEPNPYSADAWLRSLPDRYLPSMRGLIARQVANAVLPAAQAAIDAFRGVATGSAQPTGDFAAHVRAYYDRRVPEEARPSSDALMMQAAGEGIPMQPEHRKTQGRSAPPEGLRDHLRMPARER
ncbi:hypothetical protein [Nonomuraea sp. NPDC050643]|uniref:hypothetical protein n=1 Tax=Nonomuraea sp. NPDC050643 TaxID=3155660 RepID=UPI003411ED19